MVLDEIVPGYRSYKQRNKAFLILESVYHHFKDIEERDRAIQTVKNAQNDEQRWHYATWQMKVNLIYDMRHEESFWIGDYSTEERGEAVLDVLETVRHGEEFDKISKGLTAPKRGLGRKSVFIENLINDNQIQRWDLLKAKYGTL